MSILQDLEKSILSTDKLNTEGVPTASIAILEDGEISARVITKGNEDADTIYQSCSISKAITALGVARLVSEGYLDYDTKVIGWLPESTIECLVDEKTAQLMQYVTVGMLLSHTSGLSQGGFAGYAGDMPSPEAVLSGSPPANTPKVHFLSFPGAQFSYSGGGFTVLQLVLEALTNTPFPQIMQDVVLGPLGMTRSHYGPLALSEKNFAKAHDTAHVVSKAGYHEFTELAAAGLWTTPTDLLKAISAIQTSLSTTSGFLTQATARKMLSQVTETPSMGSIGMGWFTTSSLFAHAGSNDPGYNTYVCSTHSTTSQENDDSKSKHHGIAIMTNSDYGHDVAIQQICSALFYLKGWPRYGSLPSLSDAGDCVPYPAPEGAEVDGGWKEWIGKWDGDWEIVERDNGPSLAFGGLEPMRLRPGAAATRREEDEEERFVFVVDGLRVGVWLECVEDVRVVRLLQAEAKTLKRS